MTDGFELNKIIGAILFTVLIGFVVTELSHLLVHVEQPVKVAYPVPEIEAQPTETAGAGAEQGPDLATLLAKADASKGEATFKKCATCHTINEGEGAKVGPNLFGVLNRDIGSEGGFGYSATLSEMQGEWTYERINDFISDPRSYASGTKMAFAGLRRAEERADLILFLRQHGDESVPLPEPAGGQAAGGQGGEGGQGAKGGQDGQGGQGGAAGQQGGQGGQGGAAGQQGGQGGADQQGGGEAGGKPAHQ